MKSNQFHRIIYTLSDYQLKDLKTNKKENKVFLLLMVMTLCLSSHPSVHSSNTSLCSSHPTVYIIESNQSPDGTPQPTVRPTQTGPFHHESLAASYVKPSRAINGGSFCWKNNLMLLFQSIPCDVSDKTKRINKIK